MGLDMGGYRIAFIGRKSFHLEGNCFDASAASAPEGDVNTFQCPNASFRPTLAIQLASYGPSKGTRLSHMTVLNGSTSNASTVTRIKRLDATNFEIILDQAFPEPTPDGQAPAEIITWDVAGAGGVIQDLQGWNWTWAVTPTSDPLRYLATLSSLGNERWLDGFVPAIGTQGTDPNNLAVNVDGARVTRSFYNGRDELRYTVDAAGYVTRYDYDSEGRTTGTIRWDNAVTLSVTATIDAVAAAATGTYVFSSQSYDMLGRLANSYDACYDGISVRAAPPHHYEYNANGTLGYNIIAYQQADQSQIVFKYDGAGRVIERREGFGSPAASLTTYTYNAFGEVASTTDAANLTTTRVYDHRGLLLSETAAGQTTTYAYDAFGDRVKTTDARQNVSYAWYDAAGQMTWARDAQGYVTQTGYTAFGQVQAVTRYYNPVTDTADLTLVPSVTPDSAHDAVTQFGYDVLGRVLKVTDAENYYEEKTYNPWGEVSGYRNKLGGHSYYTYTIRGQLDRETVDAAVYNTNGNKVADSYVKNHYVYDARGNVVQHDEAYGLTERRTTTFVYDLADRVIEKRGTAITVGLEGSTSSIVPVERFTYDWRGNQLSSTDANGITTYRWYDNLNRRTAEIDGAGTLRIWTYDGMGNVLSERTYGDAIPGISGDPKSTAAQICRLYDVALGRLPTANEIETWAGYMAGITTGDPLLAAATNILNDSGVQQHLGTADNTFINNMYIYAFHRSATAQEVVNWQNGFNNGTTHGTMLRELSEHIDHRLGFPAPINPSSYRETTYEYDTLGRLTYQRVPNLYLGAWNGTSYDTLSNGTAQTHFEYDGAGNLVRQTLPAGGSITSYYDRLNRKIAQVDQVGYLTTWDLDGEGNVKQERRYANRWTGTVSLGTRPVVDTNTTYDRVTTFTYDRMGRRLSEQRADVAIGTVSTSGVLGSATAQSKVAYTYNGLGEVLSKTEATGDVTSYTYDNAGRLSQELRPLLAGIGSPSLDYKYDGLGDVVTTSESGTTHVTHNAYAAGVLTSATDAGGFTRSYYYDAGGRKIGEAYSRTTVAGTTAREGLRYGYDGAGRLVRQTAATIGTGGWVEAGGVTTIAYNAYGDVVSRAMNGVTQEQFEYDQAGRVAKARAGDGAWRFYLYDVNGNQTLSIESDGANLASDTLLDAVGRATNHGANSVGAVQVDGIAVTITAYNGRDEATFTRAPQRQLDDTAARVAFESSRAYTAFGELGTETDALGNTISYAYNTMGRLVTVTRPQVSITDQTGAVVSSAPVDSYAYDASGRLVATTDANGYSITRALLAGTGYGGSDALVTTEWHPDGGVITNTYDAFGNLLTSNDGVIGTTWMSYDLLGRLTQVQKPGGFYEFYAWDELGHRIRHTNSQLGSTDVESTDYDLAGRVISTRAFGGDTTTTAYTWNATEGTNGLGTLGGWNQVTTYANTKTAAQDADVWGHLISRTDMGGHQTLYTYDRAARLIAQDTTVNTTVNTQYGPYTTSVVTGRRWTWLNSGLVATEQTGTVTGTGANATFTASAAARYGYDQRGLKVKETGTAGGDTIENATANYDVLGRMTDWTESGTPLSGTAAASRAPFAQLAWTYDAAGNVSSRTTRHVDLDASGNTGAATPAATVWYRYDAMNRVTVDAGSLSGTAGAAGTVIVRGASGRDILWDTAGRRTSMLGKASRTKQVSVYTPYGTFPYLATYTTDVREVYGYDTRGVLETVSTAEQQATDNGQGGVTLSPLGSSNTRRASFSHDAMGRTTSQYDYDASGTNVVASRNWTWDTAGHAATQSSVLNRAGTVTTTSESSSYGTGTTYALGQAVSTTVASTTGGTTTTSRTDTSYDWYDGAVAKTVVYTPNTGQSATSQTQYTLDANGQATAAVIGGGQAHNVAYLLDAQNQVIRRDEAYTSGGAPHELWYRFDGRELGHLTGGRQRTL